MRIGSKFEIDDFSLSVSTACCCLAVVLCVLIYCIHNPGPNKITEKSNELLRAEMAAKGVININGYWIRIQPESVEPEKK